MLFAQQVPLIPEQASTMAPKVDAIFGFLVAVSVFFTVLIAVLVMYYAVRYRRRAPNDSGTQISGSLALEITWSAIPFVIVMISFLWGAIVYFEQVTPPDDSMQIYIVGKQWMWYAQHMGGQRENQELHVPVGRPVKL